MTGRRGVLAGTASVIALLATGAMSGCAPVACSAVGWFDTVVVTLAGDATAAVDRVQLCVDDGCAPDATGGFASSPGPLGLTTLAGHAGAVWTFQVDMGFPERFTVRALGADGAVLSDTDVAARWVRTGGSERCGGPRTATVTAHP